MWRPTARFRVEDRLVLAEQILLIGARDLARVLVRELLGGRLVLAHADELGLDAELVEEAGEVHVLRAEARVADAARRVHDDTIGVRADVERLSAVVFEATERLLAVRAQDAERVGQLFGVGVAVGRLGAEDERHRRDLFVVGDLPELPEELHVLADVGRLLDAEVDGALRARNARARVYAGDRRGGVLGRPSSRCRDRCRRARRRRPRSAERDLEPRRSDHATTRVIRDVRHLDVAAGAAHAGDVDAERRARRNCSSPSRYLSSRPTSTLRVPGGPERRART